MKLYTISIHGCDDSTIFTEVLSDEEATLVKRLCDKAKLTSTYGCMPVMEIEESNGSDE